VVGVCLQYCNMIIGSNGVMIIGSTGIRKRAMISGSKGKRTMIYGGNGKRTDTPGGEGMLSDHTYAGLESSSANISDQNPTTNKEKHIFGSKKEHCTGGTLLGCAGGGTGNISPCAKAPGLATYLQSVQRGGRQEVYS
jgi:hypothetical protein